MTNYERIIDIIENGKRVAMHINNSEKLESINKCMVFIEDLGVWIKCCNDFDNNLLVKEAQDDCAKSVIMCVQGFYKEAIVLLRQFLEHMLFAILLSTNDYNYRLWKLGKYDMPWAKIIDGINGVFGREYISIYGAGIDEERSIELTAIAKNVYRECSEFVHGNYNKLIMFSGTFEYDEIMIDKYLEYFSSIKYVVLMAMLIRFWELFEDEKYLKQIESVVVDNLGDVSEVHIIYGKE